MAGNNTSGTSSPIAVTVVRIVLTLLLVASILACIPALHQVLGMETFDAFDEGVLAPKTTAGVVSFSALLGLMFAVFLLAASAAQPRGVAVAAARVGIPAGHRAGHRTRSRTPRKLCPEDDADDHLGDPYVTTTPTLGRASA